ncbi:MAG: acylphosphatase [Erysipelotrichales bacterium]|nr:acylphosphatase [Erysipelotrichales bacterium]
MDNEEMIREHWRVEGTVQGVGFRWGMQQLAKHYHITGWVKNLYNGDVEAEVQGTKEAIAKLEEDLRKGRYYYIDRIVRMRIPAENHESSFRVELYWD